MYGNFVNGVWKADLSTASTADLQAELSRREGVNTIVVGVEDNVELTYNNPYIAPMYVAIHGPATITINVD